MASSGIPLWWTISLPNRADKGDLRGGFVLDSPGGFSVHAKALEKAAVLDLMSTMTTMDLSQWIMALTHVAGYTFDLIFIARQRDSDLIAKETKISPVS